MRAGATGRWLILTALSLGGLGCGISPLPEPPQATLEVDLVTTLGHYGPTIIGGPGAADPPGALVRAFNLDDMVDFAEGAVLEDGSFEIMLPIDPGQEARIQVVSELARSEPVDLVVQVGAPEPSPRPLSGCLTLQPPLQLELARSQVVQVRSQCLEDVQIEQPQLRRPTAGITVGAGGSWPALLGRGDSVEVIVEVDAGFELEEVFFIEASAPERDRRPMTVLPP